MYEDNTGLRNLKLSAHVMWGAWGMHIFNTVVRELVDPWEKLLSWMKEEVIYYKVKRQECFEAER